MAFPNRTRETKLVLELGLGLGLDLVVGSTECPRLVKPLMQAPTTLFLRLTLSFSQSFLTYHATPSRMKPRAVRSITVHSESASITNHNDSAPAPDTYPDPCCSIRRPLFDRTGRLSSGRTWTWYAPLIPTCPSPLFGSAGTSLALATVGPNRER